MDPRTHGGPITSAEFILFLVFVAVCVVVWLFRKGQEHAQKPAPPSIQENPCDGCGAKPPRLAQVDGYNGRWCLDCISAGAHRKAKSTSSRDAS